MKGRIKILQKTTIIFFSYRSEIRYRKLKKKTKRHIIVEWNIQLSTFRYYLVSRLKRCIVNKYSPVLNFIKSILCIHFMSLNAILNLNSNKIPLICLYIFFSILFVEINNNSSYLSKLTIIFFFSPPIWMLGLDEFVKWMKCPSKMLNDCESPPHNMTNL